VSEAHLQPAIERGSHVLIGWVDAGVPDELLRRSTSHYVFHVRPALAYIAPLSSAALTDFDLIALYVSAALNIHKERIRQRDAISERLHG
jgi:hypothetical protein